MILTKSYLFVVSRISPSYSENEVSVSCNSMGFVGTVAVKTQEELDLVKKYGPVGILEKMSEKV